MCSKLEGDLLSARWGFSQARGPAGLGVGVGDVTEPDKRPKHGCRAVFPLSQRGPRLLDA